jgi:hypothetical protein
VDDGPTGRDRSAPRSPRPGRARRRKPEQGDRVSKKNASTSWPRSTAWRARSLRPSSAARLSRRQGPQSTLDEFQALSVEGQLSRHTGSRARRPRRHHAAERRADDQEEEEAHHQVRRPAAGDAARAGPAPRRPLASRSPSPSRQPSPTSRDRARARAGRARGARAPRRAHEPRPRRSRSCTSSRTPTPHPHPEPVADAAAAHHVEAPAPVVEPASPCASRPASRRLRRPLEGPGAAAQNKTESRACAPRTTSRPTSSRRWATTAQGARARRPRQPRSADGAQLREKESRASCAARAPATAAARLRARPASDAPVGSLGASPSPAAK